jgi:hypothetical protein
MKLIILLFAIVFTTMSANADFVEGRVRTSAEAKLTVTAESEPPVFKEGTHFLLYFEVMDGHPGYFEYKLITTQPNGDVRTTTLILTDEIEQEECAKSEKLSSTNPLFTSVILTTYSVKEGCPAQDNDVTLSINLIFAIQVGGVIETRLHTTELSGKVEPIMLTMGL